jgi:hypothetical protein
MCSGPALFAFGGFRKNSTQIRNVNPQWDIFQICVGLKIFENFPAEAQPKSMQKTDGWGATAASAR